MWTFPSSRWRSQTAILSSTDDSASWSMAPHPGRRKRRLAGPATGRHRRHLIPPIPLSHRCSSNAFRFPSAAASESASLSLVRRSGLATDHSFPPSPRLRVTPPRAFPHPVILSKTLLRPFPLPSLHSRSFAFIRSSSFHHPLRWRHGNTEKSRPRQPPCLLPGRRCANVAQGGRLDRCPEGDQEVAALRQIRATLWFRAHGRMDSGIPALFFSPSLLIVASQCLQRSGW
jgi:hypothetical protein